MASLRCLVCLIDWPQKHGLYGTCPKCEGKTDAVSNATPMDEIEALSARKHHEFDRFYAKWEADRATEIQALEAAAAAVQSPPDPAQIESA